jgi:hypothetical protein
MYKPLSGMKFWDIPQTSIAMTNSSLTMLKQDSFAEKLLPSVITESYTHAKKHFHDGITAIKDEFIGMYDKAATCINRIALPINNFLKDIGEIEAEFMNEIQKESLRTTAPALIVAFPSEQALNGYLEENY